MGILKGLADGVIDGDTMWIVTDSMGCLFRYSFSKGELELEAVFPEPLVNVRGAFEQMVKLGNEIYLIPRMAEGIYCYHLTEKRFCKLNVSFEGFLDDKKMRAVVQGNYIYCINRFPDVVIRIDSVTKEIHMFRNDTKQYEKEDIERIVYRIYKEPCLYQGKIIWSNYNNILTVFHTEKESFCTITLETGPCGRIERFRGVFEEDLEDFIVGISVFEDRLWLFSFEGKIFQYGNGIKKIGNKLLDNYTQYIDADKLIQYIISNMIVLNKELWLIPSYRNKCIKYNNPEQYEEAFRDYVENWKGHRREYTLCKIWNEVNILLYSYWDSCFYVLDTKTDSVNKMAIHVPYAKLARENPEFERILLQDGFYGFDDLEYLCEKLSAGDRGGEGQKKLSSDTIGKRIYQTVRTGL